MLEPRSDYAIFKNYGVDNSFKCDGCKRVLQKAWSDEEAFAEMKSLFSGAETSDTVTYCDDCFDKLMSKLPLPQGLVI